MKLRGFYSALHVCSVPQSFPNLCDPMDCSPPGPSVHGILQARILEWVAVPSSKRSSWPRDQTHVSDISCIDRQILCHWKLHTLALFHSSCRSFTTITWSFRMTHCSILDAIKSNISGILLSVIVNSLTVITIMLIQLGLQWDKISFPNSYYYYPWSERLLIYPQVVN